MPQISASRMEAFLDNVGLRMARIFMNLLYRIETLREIFCYFSGLIIEWEDSYPLEVLRMYRQEWVYSREEAARMVKVAEDCGLVVIPLCQTFGHLEYVLKFFNFLREHPERPDCLIPIGM